MTILLESQSFLLSWLLQHTDHPIHLAAEILLITLLIYLYTTKSYKHVDERLTQREEEQLIEEWSPDPLVPTLEGSDEVDGKRIVESGVGGYVQVNGEEYLDMGSCGFLGYQKHPKLIEAAVNCTSVYGVGACGPRGFYGSIEPHMELEKKIASYMGIDDCVMFSSEFQTIASVIPAFAKPGDYLIVDKGVSFPIQIGLALSRASINWYNHNDMNDLHRVLQSLGDVFLKKKSRVFLIVESIFSNSADLLDLPSVMELKRKYPFRMILEESLSIGVLGKRGRGITEHFNVDVKEVEIITSTLGNAVGGTGGFACGSNAICEHMRLNCSGYVFSCSLPPFISKACIETFNLLEKSQEIEKLQYNIKVLHDALKELSKKLTVNGSESSPLVHLRLKDSQGSIKKDQQIIQEMSEEMFKKRVIVCASKYVSQEQFTPDPSLKITVNALHTEEEIIEAVKTLNNVVQQLFAK